MFYKKHSKMKIQLIRNATMRIEFAGKTFLADPMLSPKGAIQSFAGISPNPTIELPFSADEVIKGINAVLASHTHPDHFDKPAMDLLSKQLPVFCQKPDENLLKENSFQNVTVVEKSVVWENITITKTGGKHGSGEILNMMGEVSGFILQAKGEPTIYWIGDAIWGEEVENAIKTYNPEIIITHSGGAVIPGFPAILMDANETITVLKAAPNAKIVAIHMEALDHCTVTRNALRELANNNGITWKRLIIPNDGETVMF